MRGIINKGIQELVETKFGAEVWEKVKNSAGCDDPFFAVSEDYPDEMTLALVKAASEVTGLSPETVQLEFGKFWLSNTGKTVYNTYFQLAGSTPREFLLSMNKVHEMLTQSIINAAPPHFEYEEPPNGNLIIHYKSKRQLCAVLQGMILGVGILFDQELEVHEKECMHRGASQCTMEVIFNE